MNFLRLVILRLKRAPLEIAPPDLSFGEVTVRTQALEAGSDCKLLLIGHVPIRSSWEVGDDRVIPIPKAECRAVEEALLATSDVLGTIYAAARSVSSPVPFAAFQWTSSHERTFLEESNGIACGMRYVPKSVALPDFPAFLDALHDRVEGAAFVANAHAQMSPSGSFREYVRLFEAAFDTDKMVELRKRLGAFLVTGGAFGYTADEIRRWLDHLRHGVVHSRGPGGRVSDIDVLPVLPRVEQAAYHVLLNKKVWRSQSAERREQWKPPFGTSNAQGGIFATRGHGLSMSFQLIDSLCGLTLSADDQVNVSPDIYTRRTQLSPEGHLPPVSP